MREYHIPVLLTEVIKYLMVREGGKYIDATLGGGGYTEEILKRGGKVLGLDVDSDAIKFVQERIKNQESAPIKSESRIKKEQLVLVRGNFRNIGDIAKQNGFEQIDGIVFDIGISSYQIDQGERGFSFQQNAALDMRMDRDGTVLARDLINTLGQTELTELFQTLGEERKAKEIARAIVTYRKKTLIRTTFDLVRIVEDVYRVQRPSPKLRATVNKNVFQALRIAVNDELRALQEALPQAFGLLINNGRLAVVSFHSLEDRIVKETFQSFQRQGLGNIVTDRPITPSFEEVKRNSRSRSAKLRVIEKIL